MENFYGNFETEKDLKEKIIALNLCAQGICTKEALEIIKKNIGDCTISENEGKTEVMLTFVENDIPKLVTFKK